MNKQLLLCMLPLLLSACGEVKPETPEEKEARVNYERERNQIEETKKNVPTSEIVAKVKGQEKYIHKIYDEKTGASCYFIEYDNKISCVK